VLIENLSEHLSFVDHAMSQVGRQNRYVAVSSFTSIDVAMGLIVASALGNECSQTI
jgi:hypothetical protein